MYWDAHYQLSLFTLSLGIDLSEGATPSDVPLLVGSFAASAHLLDLVIETALGANDSEKDNKKEHNKLSITLSSSRQDAVKNAALAHVRLQAVTSVAAKFPQFQQSGAWIASSEVPVSNSNGVSEGVGTSASIAAKSANDTILVQFLRGDLPPLAALVASEQEEMSVTQSAQRAVLRFLAEQPNDKDAAVFMNAKNTYAKLLQERPGLQGSNHEGFLKSSDAKEQTSGGAAASSTKKKKRRKKSSNDASKGSSTGSREL